MRLPPIVPEDPRRQVDGEVGQVQVVVEVSVEPPVAGADFRSERQQKQVDIVGVQVERLAEPSKPPTGLVTVHHARRDVIVESIGADGPVDLPMVTQQRIDFLVGDQGSPELAFRPHRRPGTLASHRPQEQGVDSAQSSGEFGKHRTVEFSRHRHTAEGGPVRYSRSSCCSPSDATTQLASSDTISSWDMPWSRSAR